LAKIRHLLANPGEADAIRQAGYRRARRDHTWEMRFERLFTLMNLI
jgi:spore maturation protein CgeB